MTATNVKEVDARAEGLEREPPARDEPRGSAIVNGRAHFWSPAGTLLGTHVFQLGPHASLVLDAASNAGMAGRSGSITIAHDAAYGALAGKAVSIEPSTGSSFDTPFVTRPR